MEMGMWMGMMGGGVAFAVVSTWEWMQLAGVDCDETLKEVFGFESFRKGQREVIGQILKGNSALAVFPTGSGKSLCYQVPALMLEGLTIVISPLIALMKDQVDFLLGKGVSVARLDSTLTLDETRQVYRTIREGTLKLLYVAPERVSNERFFASIENVSISLMVIDEAHCISEWGHNFRPEYLKLAIAAKNLEVGRVLALTATATPSVVEDIRREFSISPEAYVNTGFHRPNLHLEFTPTFAADRMKVLKERLRSTSPGPTIVYATLQRGAEEVAAALTEAGFPAKAYHAGMKPDKRAEIQDWFMASDDGIAVATIAFGMGIDKSDIRRVFHYNLPKTLENYSQEIGRAGRDGEASFCEVLGSTEDLVTLENFIYGDTPSEESIGSFVDFILSREETFDVSLYQLSQDTDIRPLVLSTLLTYLELEGVLKFTSPFYSEYKFKYLVSKGEWISSFKPELQDFLGKLFAQAKQKKTWSYINLDTASEAIGEDRNRIVKAFGHLEETGKLEVAATGLRQGMRLLKRPDGREVRESLWRRVSRNEKRNLERTREVIDLLNVEGCKTAYLLRYFGEELDADCGHCGFCDSGIVKKVDSEGRGLRQSERESLRSYLDERPIGITSAREGARFLCGIASPRLSRTRMTRHQMFGVLAEAPFQSVIEGLSEV
ncbi:MAG: ATP-dependent DNA helicase RecQ [Verrucomicrobiota bacterium]